MTSTLANAWRPQLRRPDWSTDIIQFYDAWCPEMLGSDAIIEVGVAEGRSLLYLAARRLALGHRGVVLGVDPWQGQAHPDPELRSPCSYAQALASIVAHAQGLELEITYLMRMTSRQAARALDHVEVGGVMIDGCHRYQECREDIDLWTERIRRGGILAGHDYCERFPGVVRAVDGAFGGRHQLRGTVWAIEL